MGGKAEHSDGRLFRRLADDPNNALAAIYERHGQRVIRYLRKICKLDEDTIKDIVQDTFAVIWEKREEVANLKAPLFWMLKTANNKAMEELRKRGKIPAVPLAGYEALPASERADCELEREEISESIERAMVSLTAREREVYAAIMLDKKTNQELAEEDGVTVQAIKNSLSKGLKKLRIALGEMRSVFI